MKIATGGKQYRSVQKPKQLGMNAPVCYCPGNFYIYPQAKIRSMTYLTKQSYAFDKLR